MGFENCVKYKFILLHLKDKRNCYFKTTLQFVINSLMTENAKTGTIICHFKGLQKHLFPLLYMSQ